MRSAPAHSPMCAIERLPDRFNAAHWFLRRMVEDGRGDRLALVCDDERLTYAELDRRARRVAAALGAAGLRPGDRVAMLLPDSPALSAAFWGTVAAGGVAVPLYTGLPPREQRAILHDCAPRFLVYDPTLGRPSAAPGRTLWSVGEMSARCAATCPAAGYADTHRDGFAFMLYSSGTTGEPKGVMHRHRDAWVCSTTYAEAVLGIREDDRCFSVARIPFAYGLGNAQYFPMHAGASAVLFPGRPTPEAVFRQVRRHRPTLFFGIPTAYARMLAAMEDGAEHDFSSVRLCVSAGEALPAPIFERWRERTGIEILDGIGSTELCHIFLSNRPGACRPGSSGTPVPGYRMRIVDDDGRDLPRGRVGDLLVQGHSAAALYWNNPEATQRVLGGEWIRTGDKYLVDEDGYFWHAGRSDDMLRVSGRWVSPVEVESTLLRHEAVLECAVVGVRDGHGLVKPCAFVVVRDGARREGLEADLHALAREHLARYKHPRRIAVVHAIPKTATGKMRRFLLREG
ncbi:MAG TPA: benzoate-CoA ligase family protein, partial [Longimicrobiaceae bacterium]|nr:benzoate-CoA ligase family protein [Longimicrobiaceae bacterium]